MRIIADRDVCVGAGQCALVAGELFDQDEDGTVVVLVTHPQGDDQALAQRAAALCPSGALRVESSDE